MTAPTPSIVGAFLIRDGRVLLGLRAPHRSFYPDVWDCIGGHIEAGESCEAALARELADEIGVRPTRLASLGDLVEDDIVCRFYRVDAWSPGEPRLANDEHVELRWFAPAEACALPNLALDAYRSFLQALSPP